ncbi:Flp family type IVb pilin [Camelimonas abortus]|uniref:Flp family type IVb pilin n=1 Tax=Camelimonas abortus TaxID=1017184 RepID=A0ABV7LEM9_9HYPH
MILRGARSTSQPPSRLTASAIEHLLIATLIVIAILTAVSTMRHSLAGLLGAPGRGAAVAEAR